MCKVEYRFVITEVESPEKLAEMITRFVWMPDIGFRIQGYPEFLFLNRSTSVHNIQEFAFLRRAAAPDAYLLVASITVGFCSPKEALEYIHQTLAGESLCDWEPEWEHPRRLPLRDFDPDLDGAIEPYGPRD